MALVFDFINEIILVEAPQTSIDMQTLIDTIRDVEDELSPAMAFHKIADAYGKDDLGGGVYTAITVRLVPDWRLKFEDRPGPDTIQAYVTDGNLVGGKDDNPIAPSAYVQVIQQSSASGTISIPPSSDLIHLKYLIASLQGTHNQVGTVYYWDPYGGDDSLAGTTPDTANQTFAAINTKAQNNKYDTVIAMTTNPSGITTTTEPILITKDTLRLKGPGYNFQIIPPDVGANLVDIQAENVEFSGFYVASAAGTSGSGIRITGNNTRISNTWITNIGYHGINIIGSDFNRISKTVIEDVGNSGSGGDGISFLNGSTNNLVESTIITEAANGVSLTGASTINNVFENVLIYGNTTSGVSIGAGVTNTVIRGGQTVTNNPTNYDDNGTNTIIDTAAGITPEEVADAVWDEVISEHSAVGSTGRSLRDAKTKATLASLK